VLPPYVRKSCRPPETGQPVAAWHDPNQLFLAFRRHRTIGVPSNGAPMLLQCEEIALAIRATSVLTSSSECLEPIHSLGTAGPRLDMTQACSCVSDYLAESKGNVGWSPRCVPSGLCPCCSKSADATGHGPQRMAVLWRSRVVCGSNGNGIPSRRPSPDRLAQCSRSIGMP
jgi:hypothetical protein